MKCRYQTLHAVVSIQSLTVHGTFNIDPRFQEASVSRGMGHSMRASICKYRSTSVHFAHLSSCALDDQRVHPFIPTSIILHFALEQ